MLATEYTYDPRVAAIHKVRCNVKSLAAESRIIRHEERRAGLAYLWDLSSHRRGRLREESRYAQLALVFFRGRAYKAIERKSVIAVDAKRLTEKIRRYLPSVSAGEVEKWLA